MAEDSQKSVSNLKKLFNKTVSLFLAFMFLCFIAVGFAVLVPVVKTFSKPSPPDLSDCTHLEINCSVPIMKLLRPLDDLGLDFFNNEQREYLQTTKKFIIEDKNDIRQIARAVLSGTFKAGGTEEVNHMMYTFNIIVIGYRGDKQIAKINMYQPDFILDENNQRFNYDIFLPSPLLCVLNNIKPSILRTICAGNLWSFRQDFISIVQSEKAYPIPAKWCDFIMQYKIEEKVLSKKQVMDLFRCPSAGEGECHYAMNPNCEPNSPGDMVLLFETKAGWNQHGGPELFTFDNHAPRGGCVLLNDGTVKFVRTKEELHNLRWK